jgi:LmbE family N-acetylglucosaminyl deacetylase
MDFQTEYGAWHVPDGLEDAVALARTTHMGIGAHQDDLEIMAIEGILACYDRNDAWFAGVVVTDGSGAPRTGRFGDFTNDQMARVRIEEQKRAADIGRFGCQALLGYPTEAVTQGEDNRAANDLFHLLTAAEPEIVYTHNPLDKHDAHVGVMLKTIEAIRRMPQETRPKTVYGCEVWRDLDWVVGDAKRVLDCSDREPLQLELLRAFESQIEGKRYDLAAMGRRRANATYLEPHEIDATRGAVFAVDLTSLVQDDELDVKEITLAYVHELERDVRDRFARLI